MSPDPRRYLVLALGTAVAVSFGIHAVAPALPLLQETFGVDDFQVGLITSAYVLPGVLFAVPLGIAADLLGRRTIYASFGIFYGLMGIAQSFAPTFGWLLAGRLFQGVAFAALMPLTVTIIGDAFSGLAQVRAQAQRQVAMALANMIVPVIGAQLALLSWFLPFAASSIAILPGLLAIVVLDPGAAEKPPQVGYARRAYRSVLKEGFPSVLVLGFVRFVARFSLIAYLPIHLARELGMSLPTVGVLMGITTGLGFVSAMATARLSARARPSGIVLVALIVIGSALISLAFMERLLLVIIAMVIYALSDGLIAVLQSAYAARGTPEDVRAGLVAVNGTARNAGKFLGPILLGLVAAWSDIEFGFAVVGVLVIASGILLPRGLVRLDTVLQTDDAVAEVPRTGQMAQEKDRHFDNGRPDDRTHL